MTTAELGYETGKTLGVAYTALLYAGNVKEGDLKARVLTDLEHLAPRTLWDLPFLDAFERGIEEEFHKMAIPSMKTFLDILPKIN